MTVASRIVSQAHPFYRGCRLSQRADNAPIPETARERGYGVFAFEDEEEYYAEDGEDEAYEVEGEALKNCASGADVGRSCEVKKVADVLELVPDVVCS
jgi:hypothetical protein